MVVVVARGNRFVGVERQDPVARRLLDGEVSRHAEIVLPREVEDPRAELARDLDCSIGAAGVDDDQVVPQAAYRFETAPQVRVLVLRNQADAERRHTR